MTPPSLDTIQTFLAWAFNNPATAIAVLVVGWRVIRRADAFEAAQADRDRNAKQRELELLAAVAKVEHAATSILGTHELTRELMKRLTRQLSGKPEDV